MMDRIIREVEKEGIIRSLSSSEIARFGEQADDVEGVLEVDAKLGHYELQGAAYAVGNAEDRLLQPLNAELIPYQLPARGLQCYAVRFDGFQGGRIAGWYLRPDSAAYAAVQPE